MARHQAPAVATRACGPGPALRLPAPRHRLRLTLEGVNLTDEYQSQYVDSRQMLSVYHHTGREFLAGVRYTF